jgi:predicted nucleic acid-binding Zn ribbon protein
MPPDSDVADVENPAPVDLARAALANAQTLSRSRPGKAGERNRAARRRTRSDNLAGRTGGYSGPGPDPARDPQPVGQVLSGYVQDRGWERPLAEGRVFTDWSQLVGHDVAAHCEPVSLLDGELRIAAQSTAWATQLRLLAGTLLARLVAELGPQVVTKLHITGPVAPSWKHGGRSVRGHRGPRDTYG